MPKHIFQSKSAEFSVTQENKEDTAKFSDGTLLTVKLGVCHDYYESYTFYFVSSERPTLSSTLKKFLGVLKQVGPSAIGLQDLIKFSKFISLKGKEKSISLPFEKKYEDNGEDGGKVELLKHEFSPFEGKNKVHLEIRYRGEFQGSGP